MEKSPINSHLTDVSYLTSLLARAGIEPKGRASQNFLICPPVVEAALEAARAGPQAVTELGAGVGVMTEALLSAHFHVRAIERDRGLAQLLVATLPPPARERLTLVVDDLKETSWEHEAPYQIVGNIPYHLSGFIIRKLTQLDPAPAQIILLVQKEVGRRMMALPPELQLMGLSVQLWGRAKVLRDVAAGCFWPAPKVDSSLMFLTPHPLSATMPLKEREAILACARRFFTQRRKQMGGVLRRWQGLDDAAANALLKQADIRPTQRPQEVAADQWAALASLLTR